MKAFIRNYWKTLLFFSVVGLAGGFFTGFFGGFWVFLPITLLMVFAPIIYSYILHRKGF